MGYAIRLDGLGWRAVDSAEDVVLGETYSETQPAPASGPEAAPGSVTMRQARLALLAAGLLADVNAAVAALPGIEGDAARIEWEFSAHVERQQPLVQAMAAVLALTEQQLDDLFTAAAAL